MSQSKPKIIKVSNLYGDKLRFYREKHKLTQIELADKVLSTLSTISAVENGLRTLMDKDVMHKIRKYLGFSYTNQVNLIIADRVNNLQEYFKENC